MTFQDRYVWLTVKGIKFSAKLDDEGVVVDAWDGDECIASTWKTYPEFGVRAMFFDSHVQQPLKEEKDES